MVKYSSEGFIKELGEKEIFVFGSNADGAHLGGAAGIALTRFGAIMGQSEGLQGQSYGINTMSGLDTMKEQIMRFLDFAKSRPELTFYVTELGCGIAGYAPEQIAPLFKGASENVILPKNFSRIIDSACK
ncbi:hypothetical protein IKF63_02305 [Candidatus Saccharibacteria bacterium]|nr:hypothetical protein [Candidatus Saccharibacteria bacterium]